tara:strand:- start:15792 stop:16079 length:288 start_codon:yes stop_codon:yes gene_type:complete
VAVFFWLLRAAFGRSDEPIRFDNPEQPEKETTMSYRSFVKALETYQCNNQKFMPHITDEQIANVFKPEDQLSKEDLRLQNDLFGLPPEAILNRGQ